MNLSSLFPSSKTLGAQAAAKQAAKDEPGQGQLPAGSIPPSLADLMKRKRPGEFSVTWPRMRVQGVKDYLVITTAQELREYVARCEETGLGGFDYETAADQQERDSFARYSQDMKVKKLAAEDAYTEALTEIDQAKDKAAYKKLTKAHDDAIKALDKEYETALKDHKRSPLDPHKSHITAMSLAAQPDEARAIFINNPGRKQFEPDLSRDDARQLLMDTLEEVFFTNQKIVKIAVNMNFEERFTAKYGKYILMPVADPFIMWIRLSQLLLPHKIKNPKRPYTGKGLKTMTKEVFGVTMTNFEALLEKFHVDFFSEIPNDTQDAVSYCCEDSDYAVQHYLYWDAVAKQIENANTVYPTYSDWLHNIEMPFTRVTGLMEYWGMYWDSDVAAVKRQEAEIMQQEAAEEMTQIAKRLGVEINVGAAGKTGDVKSFIFDTLKVPAAAWSSITKDPSLDGNAIMDMIFMLENKLIDPDEEKYLGAELPEGWEQIDADKDPSLDKATRQKVRISQRQPHPHRDDAIAFLQQMQKIQKYATLLSSHIEGREKYVNPRTGRIHANYEPWTETSRLASMNPNGQNVPRPDNDDLGIRNFYKAAPGKVLVLEDESGFELRITAYKSKCPVMIPAFLHNEDLHKKTAATMTRKPVEEVTKHERSAAKAGNFGSVYGGTEHALQKTFKKLGIRRSLDECKVIVDAVKTTYPGIPAYQVDAVILAREKGYAETIYGFKRLLPAINSADRRSRGDDERRSQNTPIQGSAADIMKKSQNAIYEKIGLDTAAKRLGQLPEIWEGFDEPTTKLLEVAPFMEHGKTDMVAQIHDEIISELDDDPDLVEQYANWQKAVMEVPPLPDFPIPLEAEASAAYSWGNKKDFGKWLEERKAANG